MATRSSPNPPELQQSPATPCSPLPKKYFLLATCCSTTRFRRHGSSCRLARSCGRRTPRCCIPRRRRHRNCTLPLMVDVAVEVFVVINGIRGRIAGVSAVLHGPVRGDVVRHFAVVARAASPTIHPGPVVEAFHRPPTRGAVVVVRCPSSVVAHLRRREAATGPKTSHPTHPRPTRTASSASSSPLQ